MNVPNFVPMYVLRGVRGLFRGLFLGLVEVRSKVGRDRVEGWSMCFFLLGNSSAPKDWRFAWTAKAGRTTVGVVLVLVCGPSQ